MINYLLKKLSTLGFSNGNIVADKSCKFDTLFFICKFLNSYISTDNLYIDLSGNNKDEITNQIVEVFNKNEDSNGNGNYLSEILNYLSKIDVIEKESTDKYIIKDDVILQFITSSLENAYICQYISIYCAFLNNNLWQDYVEYTKISIDNNNKPAKLLDISNKISSKSPTISNSNSQWAFQTTMYYLELLGLANDEYGITRNLTIKSDKLTPKDLSANVKGTRSIGEKNDFYLHDFKLKYVKKMLETVLVSSGKEEKLKPKYEYCKTGDAINLVIYGTPGCGKSYMLNEMLKKDKYIDNDGNEQKGLNISEDHMIRTTFHHDYSNTDFVGQIVPQVNSDGSAKYIINPGPFTKALTLAFNTKEDVALVIEELNRGDAAGILGDIFQLFDRYKDNNNGGKKGVSQYPIENNLIQAYLTEHTNYRFDSIRIPSNLYIFATMNTSDQNVFTLDTAFKRRWDFLKMKNNYIKYDEDCENEILYVPGSYKKWTDFVKQLNKKMLKLNGQVNEDKQLGLYFVDKDLLAKKENEYDEEKTKKFAFKVLEYLWDDVVRYDHTELFDNKIETLDDLVDKFVKLSKDKKESTLVFKDDTFIQNENE